MKNYYAFPGMSGITIGQLKDKLALTASDLLITVAQYTGVPVEVLKSKNRAEGVVFARHLYCYLGAKYLKCSLKNIGAAIMKDHATVMHGRSAFENRLQYAAREEKERANTMVCAIRENLINKYSI